MPEMFGELTREELENMAPRFRKFYLDALRTNGENDVMDRYNRTGEYQNAQPEQEPEQPEVSAEPEIEMTEPEAPTPDQNPEIEEADLAPDQVDLPDFDDLPVQEPDQESAEPTYEPGDDLRNDPGFAQVLEAAVTSNETSKGPTVESEDVRTEEPENLELNGQSDVTAEETRDEPAMYELDLEQKDAHEKTINYGRANGWQSARDINYQTMTPEQQKNMQHLLADIVNIEGELGYTLLTHVEDEPDRREQVGVVLDSDDNLLGVHFLEFNARANRENQLSMEAVKSISSTFGKTDLSTGLSPEERLEALGYHRVEQDLLIPSDDPSKKPKVVTRVGYQFGDFNDTESDLAVRIMLPIDPTSDNPADRSYSVAMQNNRNLSANASKTRIMEQAMRQQQMNNGIMPKETDPKPFEFMVNPYARDGSRYATVTPDNFQEVMLAYKKNLMHQLPNLSKSGIVQRGLYKDFGPNGINSAQLPFIVNEIARKNYKPPENKIVAKYVKPDRQIDARQEYLSNNQMKTEMAQNYNAYRNEVLKFHSPELSYKTAKAAGISQDFFVPPEVYSDPAKADKDSRMPFSSEKARGKTYQNEMYDFHKTKQVNEFLTNEKGQKYLHTDKDGNPVKVPQEYVAHTGLLTMQKEHGTDSPEDREIREKIGLKEALMFPGKQTTIELPDKEHTKQTFTTRIDPKLNDPNLLKKSGGYPNWREEYKTSSMNSWMSPEEYHGYRLTDFVGKDLKTRQDSLSRTKAAAMLVCLSKDQRIDLGLTDPKTNKWTARGQYIIDNDHIKQLDNLKITKGKTFEQLVSPKRQELYKGSMIKLAQVSYDYNNELLRDRAAFSQEISNELNLGLKGRVDSLTRALVDHSILDESMFPKYRYEIRYEEGLAHLDEIKDKANQIAKDNGLNAQFEWQPTGRFDNDAEEHKYQLVNKAAPEIDAKTGKQKTDRYDHPVYKAATPADLGYASATEMRKDGFDVKGSLVNLASPKVATGETISKTIRQVADDPENSLRGSSGEARTDTIVGGYTKRAYRNAGVNPDVWQDSYDVRPIDMRANKINQVNKGFYQEDLDNLGNTNQYDSIDQEFTPVMLDRNSAGLSTIPNPDELFACLDAVNQKAIDQKVRGKVEQKAADKQMSKEEAKDVEAQIAAARNDVLKKNNDRQRSWNSRGKI